MREFLSTGLGIVALVFTILGVVFSIVGLALTAFVEPQAIGITFFCLGCGFLAVGVGLGAIRLAAIQRRTWLLETGVKANGTIVELAQNMLVRLNGQHPWEVRYQYVVQGCEYQGSETMMDLPAGYAQGASVAVRYDPACVEESALFRDEKEVFG
jgi:hypothetical protein